MSHPKITADQIAKWATSDKAASALPELLRRLIYASGATVRSIHAPVGKNTNLGGYDMRLEVHEERSHVPGGESVWEMGVREDVLKKLDEDYAARTKDPLGVEPAQTAYVAVTAHKFPMSRNNGNAKKTHYSTHQDWASSKSGGPWREVRVVDAGVLEGWLAQAPAVASWFAREHVGEAASGVTDAAHYLESWRPKRALVPWALGRLLCAGREDDVEEVRRWVEAEPRVLQLQAQSWQEVALFAAAALLHQPWARQAELEGRVLVVTTQEAWQGYTLPNAAPNAVLIAAFPDAARIARQTPAHVHALIPCSAGPDGGGRPLREQPADALGRVLVALFGQSEREANETVRGAGRSVMGVLRRLEAAPAPTWVHKPDTHKLIPALLAGQWSMEMWREQPRYRDAEVFTMFPSLGSLEVLTNGVILSIFGAESPLEEVTELRGRGTVRWRGREEAWRFLQDQLSHSERYWESVIALVYSTPDERFDLPVRERVYASLREDLERGFSAALRVGLAEGLLLYARAGERAARFVMTQVARVLDTIDWRRWATLGDVLPLLAAAAPAAFLNALETTLSVPSRLAPLFEAGESFGDRHAGYGLIHALELIAWWPEHTQRVVLVLFRLGQIQGVEATTTKVLEGIFNPWMPQTAMSGAERAALLDRLATRAPELVWSMRLGWLQSARGGILPRHERPADIEDARVTQRDLVETFSHIVNGLLAHAGADSARWCTLLEHADQFWHVAQPDAFLNALNAHGASLSQNEQFMWVCRVALNRHYKFACEDEASSEFRFWSELLTLYRQHEPSEAVQRRWLFEHSRLEDPAGDLDWSEEDARCHQLRMNAVRELWQGGELEAFILGLDLSEVRERELVATYLGLVIDDGELYQALSLNIPPARAGNFWDAFFWALGSRAIERGELLSWLEQLFSLINAQIEELREPMMVGLVRRLPITDETLTHLEALGGEALLMLYWNNVPLFSLADGPVDLVLSACAACLDVGRLGDVLEFLVLHQQKWKHWGDEASDSLLAVFQRLMDAVITDVGAVSREQIVDLSWRLQKMHSYVFKNGGYDPQWLAQWEFLAFDLVRDHDVTVDGPAYLELFRQLEREPSFFVELLSYWTSRDDGEFDERGENIAVQAYKILQDWRTRPGRDGISLMDWVEKALSKAAEVGRFIRLAEEIGKVLAYGGIGEDGVWPDEEVRGVLEFYEGKQALLNGFSRGVYLRHMSGVHWLDGGRRQRQLEEQYRGWATSLEWDWSVTARLLRLVADAFEIDARKEEASEAFERMNRSFQMRSVQEGFFTRLQAEREGLHDLDGLVERGEIEQVYADVFRVKNVPTVTGDSRVEALLPVWLWSGKEGVFCDRTALNLLNLSNDSPERVYILLNETQREFGLQAPEGVEVLYGPRPEPTQIAWFEGRLPYTNAAHTLNYCARSHVDADELREAIHRGLRAGLFTPDEINDALEYTSADEQVAN